MMNIILLFVFSGSLNFFRNLMFRVVHSRQRIYSIYYTPYIYLLNVLLYDFYIVF